MKLDMPYATPYIEDEALHERGAFELAIDLIGLSACDRTSVHLRSIEVLLTRAALARPSAQRFLDEAWPPIRARLSSYPAF
jgi:hypothetical protein